MKRKVILAIADGVGDRPIESLNNLTPLQAANTPWLDLLATNGQSGLVDIVNPGFPVGTDLGHMVLFGYDEKDYPGRGPIEAFGRGIKMQPGDVAFRANFATVDDNMNLIDRRAGRIRSKTDQLAKSLSGLIIEDVQFIVKEATEHRALVIMRGEGLSANVSDSDPKIIEGEVSYNEVMPLDNTNNASKTARIINIFYKKSHEILNNHPINQERVQNGLLPANLILTRGAGIVPKLEKITEKFGFDGAVIAAEGTVLGVSRMAGFDIVTDDSFTGNLDTNVIKKAGLALIANELNDFVAINVKAPDLMGHDNEPQKKVQAIEMFDEMIGHLYRNLPSNTLLAVVADHSTPCERMEHSGDPVPALIYGPGVRVDRNNAYNEIDCMYGGIGRIKGNDFINTLFDYMEVTQKKGN